MLSMRNIRAEGRFSRVLIEFHSAIFSINPYILSIGKNLKRLGQNLHFDSASLKSY